MPKEATQKISHERQHSTINWILQAHLINYPFRKHNYIFQCAGAK